MLAFSVEQDCHVHQLDITVAYLNRKLSETVFMELPPLKLHEKPNEEVYLFKKERLDGLHQSGWECSKCLDKFFKSVKVTRSRADSCIYFDKEKELIVDVYADDHLVMCSKDSTNSRV